MARRRLAPVDPAALPRPHAAGSGAHPAAHPAAIGAAAANVPRAEHSPDGPARFAAAAPIASVAAEAAAGAALDEMAETLRAAREEGRLVLDLALDAVAPDHLARDRIPADDAEMAALKASIRAHGQRTAIEVTPLGGPLPYGLISGWRRLAALKALRAETGDERFATIRALVLRPESAEAAYVAMVEENEIRVGLSYYERARVAALATRRGIFPSEKKALLALFATASRAKRSRIRAFLDIYHALDGTLRFPQALPERLGLRLVELVRAGGRDRVAAAVARADPATPEAELAALHDLVAAGERPARRPGRGGEPTAGEPGAGEPGADELRPGVTLETRRRGETLTLTLKGRGVTAALEAEVRAAVLRLREDAGR